MKIVGILSVNEFNFLNENNESSIEIKRLNVVLQKGGKDEYKIILGILEKPQKSNNILNLVDNEKSIISNSIIDFILKIEEFKASFQYI